MLGLCGEVRPASQTRIDKDQHWRTGYKITSFDRHSDLPEPQSKTPKPIYFADTYIHTSCHIESLLIITLGMISEVHIAGSGPLEGDVILGQHHDKVLIVELRCPSSINT